MSLTSNLRQHSISWQIDRVDVPSTRYPDRLIGQLRVQLFMPALPGESIPAHEVLLQGYSASESVEQLLARVLRTKLPDHPVYRAWLDARGNVPVTMSEDAIEYVGESLHTAMRKLAGSPESAIQWNSVHHLSPADWSALLEHTRGVLRKLKADTEPEPLLRRDVGFALKEAFVSQSEALLYPGHRRDADPRTELQKFALLCLHLACKGTDDDEWVWSWTGYLCEEVKPTATSGATTKTVAEPA